MTIFLGLNGLGVIFLMYVLVNFWREGRRPKKIAPRYAAENGHRGWAEVHVVTHPISHSGQRGLSVIPFPAREPGLAEGPTHRVTSLESSEFPARRISTR
jgi:hypothetical protein